VDTITHGIVGALAGKALFAGRDVPSNSCEGGLTRAESSPTARAALTACTLGAIFPDIDVFGGLVARNPLAIMEWHRNITHSAVMLPIWALLLAGISLLLARWVPWKRPSFLELAGIYAFALATHVFLDGATNFGTMVWSPINYSRLAWDWLFIVDFSFTGIALAPQLAAWCYRAPNEFGRRAGVAWSALTAGAFGVYAIASAAGYGFPRWVVGVASALMAAVIFLPAIDGRGFGWRRANWCRVGMAALCLYVALAAAAHRKAVAYVDDYAAAHHLQVEKRAALPLPPTLTHWAGLLSTPEGVWRITFHVPSGAPERAVLYADAKADRYIEAAKKLRDVQTYLWFARFPVWRVERNMEETVVEITDVRFFREGQNGPGRPRRVAGLRTNARAFSFDVVFDGDGRVVSHGFTEDAP
jgi:membrane-bound metal-dependent hydrolase YbcI (DUF457 family)